MIDHIGFPALDFPTATTPRLSVPSGSIIPLREEHRAVAAVVAP